VARNCGSVFVNPVPGEVAAGALIDAAGLRGLRIGTAWVSEKHANFVQAGEGGRAADVRAVIEAVRERVASTSGWHLRSEVRMVGFPIDGAAP
jgi:UDP-N-acetylmuramate dehydrogenase